MGRGSPQAERERDRRRLVETSRKRLSGKRLEWERDGRLYTIKSTATKQRAAV